VGIDTLSKVKVLKTSEKLRADTFASPFISPLSVSSYVPTSLLPYIDTVPSLPLQSLLASHGLVDTYISTSCIVYTPHQSTPPLHSSSKSSSDFAIAKSSSRPLVLASFPPVRGDVRPLGVSVSLFSTSLSSSSRLVSPRSSRSSQTLSSRLP
jgi:hypothetical protein